MNAIPRSKWPLPLCEHAENMLVEDQEFPLPIPFWSVPRHLGSKLPALEEISIAYNPLNI